MSLVRAGMQDLATWVFASRPVARLALLRACWRLAVGDDLARRTEVLALEGATLRLRVPDARWRKVLHRMERDILWRFRQSVGDLAPKRLGFTEGPVAALDAGPERAGPPEARPVPERIAASATAIPDPEIRERFLETAARYLSRAQS